MAGNFCTTKSKAKELISSKILSQAEISILTTIDSICIIIILQLTVTQLHEQGQKLSSKHLHYVLKQTISWLVCQEIPLNLWKLLTQIHGCFSASDAVIRFAGLMVSILLIRSFASGVTVSHSGEGNFRKNTQVYIVLYNLHTILPKDPVLDSNNSLKTVRLCLFLIIIYKLPKSEEQQPLVCLT